MTARIFVYGSLRSDAYPAAPEAARASAILAIGATREARASLAGRLYAPSWSPAFVPGFYGRIRGEIWRVPDTKLLVRLDRYEGGAYVRERRRALLDDGRRVTSWVYRYVAACRVFLSSPRATMSSGCTRPDTAHDQSFGRP